MLKLNASYSKKVPAETEYSSQSYHAEIEIELPDGLTQQQLQEKVHNVFDFVRNSVEAELHNTSQMQLTPQAVPSQQQPALPQPAQQASQPPQPYYEPLPQPQQQSYLPPQPVQPTNNGRPYKSGNGNASPKQVNYLLSLAKRAGWTVQQILQRCQVGAVELIPSRLCSQLIQEFSGTAA